MITLYNYFHATSTRIRAGRINARKVLRIRRRLCPDTCKCSGVLGIREGNGPGEVSVKGGKLIEDYDVASGETYWSALEE